MAEKLPRELDIPVAKGRLCYVVAHNPYSVYEGAEQIFASLSKSASFSVVSLSFHLTSILG